MYHDISIHNICPDITIMTPRILFRDNLMNMSIIYVENMIIPWINQNVHIVTKLLRIYVCNSQSEEKE